MRNVKLALGCAVLFVLTVAATPAQAQGPWGGYGYGYRSIYSMDSIPYFAMHPPVYYSYPVPRTYGYSPFAYPPGVMTPEVSVQVAPAPKMMSNPHVPKASVASPDRTASRKVQPQLMINPYVDRAATASVAQAER